MVNVLGRLDPKTGQIKEFALKTPASGPHGLTEDKAGNIWYTGNSKGAHRKARSENGAGDGISDARSRGERSALARVRSERHALVHGAGRQHGGAVESRQRRARAAQFADDEVAALRHHDQLEGRSVLRRVRREQSGEHRSRDDGHSRVDAAECRLASAAAGDRRAGQRVVFGLLARISRQARSGDVAGERVGVAGRTDSRSRMASR